MLKFFLGEAVFKEGLNVSWTDLTSLEWYWYLCHHESFIVSFLFSLKPEPLPLIMVQERTWLVQISELSWRNDVNQILLIGYHYVKNTLNITTKSKEMNS